MNNYHYRAHLTSLAAALVVAACGGGGSPTAAPAPTPAPAPVPAPTPTEPAPPLPIAGDPPFTSGCTAAAPARASIGPFLTQPGDCFVSLQISPAELAQLRVDYTSAPVRSRVLEEVRSSFNDRIDSIMVIVDQSQTEQEAAKMPYGFNSAVQACNVHTPNCPRFGRLGALWLTARDYLDRGPSLHELLHGFHAGMTRDGGPGFVIPTQLDAHWGYSSAGGQLGGWSTVQKRSDGSYVGTVTFRGGGSGPFNSFANGGNAVAYSNLELWTMGLIPDAELQSVDVAQWAVPSTTEPGLFTATGMVTYSAEQIIARVLPQSRPSTAAPRAWRGLVVLATTDATASAATREMLNGQIDRFSQRGTPPAGAVHNWWSATGGRSSMQLAAASTLGK